MTIFAKNGPRIVAVFPDRNIGGAQMLFFRVLKTLQSQYGAPVGLVDYSDGWIANKLRQLGVPFDHLVYDPDIPLAHADDIILMPTCYVRRLRGLIRLHPENRLFLWTIHPQNLRPWPNFIKSNERRWPKFIRPLLNSLFFWHVGAFRKIVGIAHRNHAIAFMDGANLDAFEKHLPKLENPLLLPIPVEITPAKTDKLSERNAQPSVFGWLGRVDRSFKQISIRRAILDADDWAAQTGAQGIRFNVIGNGDGEDDLRSWLDDANLHIEVTLLGARVGEALSAAFADIDVLFAMGTAALDGGAALIPTLMTDFSYTPLKRPHSYRWLFKQERYDLGRNIQDPDYVSSGASLQTLLTNFDRHAIGNACSEYVARNHNIKNQIETIARSIYSTSLRWRDVEKHAPMGWLKVKQPLGST